MLLTHWLSDLKRRHKFSRANNFGGRHVGRRARSLDRGMRFSIRRCAAAPIRVNGAGGGVPDRQLWRVRQRLG